MGGEEEMSTSTESAEMKALKALKKKMEELAIGNAPGAGLPRYKGRWDELDLNQFLKKFYAYGNLMGWNELRCCKALPYCLENDALAAYESIGDADIYKDWKALCDALAVKLARYDDLSFTRRKLMDAQQGPKESLLEFAMRVGELVERAYPTAKNFTDPQKTQFAVDHFMNGIRDGRIQDRVMREKPTSVRGAMNIAMEEENLMNRKRNNNSGREELTKINEEIKRLNERIEVNFVRPPQNQAQKWWNRKPQEKTPQNQGQRPWRQNVYKWGPKPAQFFQGRPIFYNRFPRNNSNQQGSSQEGNSGNQNNGNRGNWNNWRNKNPNNRGQNNNRGGRGGRRGGYSINAVTNPAYMLPSMTVLTCLCILAQLCTPIVAKEYLICPQPRVGYLLSSPVLQNCEKQIEQKQNVEQREIEIYVPRTAPVFIPAFKCVKQITQYCTKTIFLIQIDDWQANSTEFTTPEECWSMANQAVTLNGTKLVKMNEDLWQTEIEEISKPYPFWGTICVNASTWKLQVGTVGSLDGEGMASEMAELSRCKPETGNCIVDSSTIIWPQPNLTTFCIYTSAGKYNALIYEEYILVEEVTAAFIASPGNIPEKVAKCVPEGAKLMENEVIISFKEKRVKRGANNQNTRQTLGNPPPYTGYTTRTSTSRSTIQSSTVKHSPTARMAATTLPTAKWPSSIASSFRTNKANSYSSTRATTTRASTHSTVASTRPRQTSGTMPMTSYSTLTAMTSTTRRVDPINSTETPIKLVQKEEVFREYFEKTFEIKIREMDNRYREIINDISNKLASCKSERIMAQSTTVHPQALALEGTYRQDNNNQNVKMQYMSAKQQDILKENFGKIWAQICQMHNFQISLIQTLLKINVKEGVRLWLNRMDLTAVHNGEAILVAPCTTVKPSKIFWSNKIGNICFEYTPVRVQNMTFFILPGTSELVLHSPNVSCEDRIIPAYQDEQGYWRTAVGSAQVSTANQQLVFKSKQKLLKFRAASLFNSDLHRIAMSVSLLEAYAKRINEKVMNIPKMTHITENSLVDGLPMDFLEAAKQTLSTVIDTAKNVSDNIQSSTINWLWNKIKERIVSIWESMSFPMKITAISILTVIIFGLATMGYIYAYPIIAPIMHLFRAILPNTRQNRINVNAVNTRSDESLHMLNYFPKIYSVNWKKGKHAYVNVRLNGKRVRALVDPGSEISYCRKSLAEKLELVVDSSDKPCGKAANSSPIQFLGSAEVKVKFGDYIFAHPILISEDGGCPAAFLIGSDITDDVRLNFNEKFVEFRGQTLPMVHHVNVPEKVHKIFIAEDTILPAKSDNAIWGYTKSRFPSDEQFLVQNLNHKYDFLIIGKSVVNPGSTGKIALRAMNSGKKPIKLYAGSNVAILEVIDANFNPKVVFDILEISRNSEENESKEVHENWHDLFPDLNAHVNQGESFKELDLTGCCLSPEGKSKLIEIIKRNHSAFSLNGEIGRYNGPIKHRIPLIPGSAPPQSRPFRTPFAMREEEKKHLDDLIDKGIIRPSTSPFSAPIVMVKKKDGSFRMAIDYRRLNKITVPETYILPLIGDILDVAGGQKFYANIDFKRAYYQVEIQPEDIEKTAFSSIYGLYEFIRMPFGLKSAPSCYVRIMNQLAAMCSCQTLVFLDDVCICSSEESEHLRDINQFLQVVSKNGMKLHLGKCKWGQKEIKFLGFLVSEQGIRPDPKNIEAVKNFEKPKTITQLRSFIGCVSYFRKFVSKFSVIMKPLYEMLKTERIEWKEPQDKAFQTIIERLTTAPVLKTPKWGKQFIIETDASAEALSACLRQTNEENEEHPIAYWSRILNKHEKNYHSTELECLALVEALKQFEHYVLGSGQTLARTDNSTVCSLLNKKEAKGRIAKFQMIVQNFDLKFEHKPGKSNKFCDYLSRHPAPSAEVTVKEEKVKICEINTELCTVSQTLIRKETQKDKILAKVLRQVKNGWVEPKEDETRNYFELREFINEENGILEMNGKIIIPKSLQESMLKALHRAHFGITKTKAKAAQLIYWPNISRDIEQMISACTNCNRFGSVPAKTELHQWNPTERPWERIHMDFGGPFLGVTFLVLIDAYSRYPFITVMKGTTATNTIEALEEIFCLFGYPRVCVSDNGPQLTSNEFEEYTKEKGIIHKFSPPYKPQCNGLAERTVRDCKEHLNKILADQVNPTKKAVKEAIQLYLFEYRSTPHSATKQSPAKLFLKREIKTDIDMLLHFDKKSLANEKAREAQKENFDKNAHVKQFAIGNPIWMRVYNDPKQKWKEAVIIEAVGNVIFRVRDLAGTEHVVHCDQLKKREWANRQPTQAECPTTQAELELEKEK